MRSKYEIKSQKILESQDYRVDYKIRPSRRMRMGSYTPDYFGLFDLLAIKKGQPMLWISVKGHAGVPSKHKEAIKKFPLPKDCVKQIWVYTRSKKLRVISL